MAEIAPDVGVVLPEVDGKRSTTAFGKEVLADALRTVAPDRAADVDAERDWRTGYLSHFRALVEAGVAKPEDALTIARDGLTSLHSRMVVARDGAEKPLGETFASGDPDAFVSATVKGSGERRTELAIPYRGERLTGDALQRRLDDWVSAGVIEPSCADAVRTVAAHPDWLDLSDRRVVVLGAGAEMGPLPALLAWGADLVGIDLPSGALWHRVLATARKGAGTLTVPIRAAAAPSTEDDAVIAAVAGANLLVDGPALVPWLAAHDDRPLVIGNYVYADGVLNLRVATAVDALSVALLERRRDSALAFLATPTDVFAVPPEVVEDARRRWRGVGPVARLRAPLRAASGGRLFRPHYRRTFAGGVGIADSIVPQQGPNYALAKRLQRWRGYAAAADGVTVSLNVAPPTRTRSVVKNRALAAAYAGAKRFGIEVFDPATSNTLMAALLVHDLRTGTPAGHPHDMEVSGAAHGGLWRNAYEPRSVLGLAVLMGLGGARS